VVSRRDRAYPLKYPAISLPVSDIFGHTLAAEFTIGQRDRAVAQAKSCARHGALIMTA
jgi:hypothetical protein